MINIHIRIKMTNYIFLLFFLFSPIISVYYSKYLFCWFNSITIQSVHRDHISGSLIWFSHLSRGCCCCCFVSRNNSIIWIILRCLSNLPIMLLFLATFVCLFSINYFHYYYSFEYKYKTKNKIFSIHHFMYYIIINHWIEFKNIDF